MAITWIATVESRWRAGKKRMARVKLTTSASGNTYSTGGDAIPAAGAMGMKRNVDYIVISDMSNADGYLIKFDQVNQKLLLYIGDNNNAADAPMVEETAATAYNSKTVFCVVTGA